MAFSAILGPSRLATSLRPIRMVVTPSSHVASDCRGIRGNSAADARGVFSDREPERPRRGVRLASNLAGLSMVLQWQKRGLAGHLNLGRAGTLRSERGNPLVVGLASRNVLRDHSTREAVHPGPEARREDAVPALDVGPARASARRRPCDRADVRASGYLHWPGCRSLRLRRRSARHGALAA